MELFPDGLRGKDVESDEKSNKETDFLIYRNAECYNFFVQTILCRATFPGLNDIRMSVKINVYYFLPHLTEDQEIVEVDGNTVGECLEKLVKRFPKAKEWLFGKDGNLSKFLDVYVNLEEAYPDELNTPVKDGDEIHIVMQLTGG